MKSWRRDVLEGLRAGTPRQGPSNVHVDVTNACNAACITCWDHSPLLHEARPRSWKARSLAYDDFAKLVDELAAMGSVRAFILSGMGDPLVHPDIYRMIALVKQQGWHLTMLTNLVAADIDRLEDSGVDQLLVGVHGARPASYVAFHPGWSDAQFNTMCRHLRRLRSAGVTSRHVQVINRDNAEDVPAMVRFGKVFGAERVNFKLASLADGTDACAVTSDQLDWLLAEGLAEARALAAELDVHTNLELFEQQLRAARTQALHTTPMAAIGCFMGYVYTRITVDREVLFCCNTNVRVGSLDDASFAELWYGDAWQALRRRLSEGDYFKGCERCGKFEQNVKWSERHRELFGTELQGSARAQPRTRLRVV